MKQRVINLDAETIQRGATSEIKTRGEHGLDESSRIILITSCSATDLRCVFPNFDSFVSFLRTDGDRDGTFGIRRSRIFSEYPPTFGAAHIASRHVHAAVVEQLRLLQLILLVWLGCVRTL